MVVDEEVEVGVPTVDVGPDGTEADDDDDEAGGAAPGIHCE